MSQQELLDLLQFEPDNELAIHELIESMPGDTDDERLIEAARLVDALSEPNLTKAIHDNDGSVSATFQDLGDRHFIKNDTNELYYQCYVCEEVVNDIHFRKHMLKHADKGEIE